MTATEIAADVIARGLRFYEPGRQARGIVEEQLSSAATGLVNDLENHPHAFVLACVMDRQLQTHRVWGMPYLIAQDLGGFELERLARLSVQDMFDLMQRLKLHRFRKEMAECWVAAVARIRDKYEGDATGIWAGTPSSAEVVYRFLEFKGVGPKIATMAVNILSRDFLITFSDRFSIDISADRHVRRVMRRLGLVPQDASIEQVVYKARSLYPSFPGVFDLPLFETGRTWCLETNPKCSGCPMDPLCPKVGVPQAGG